MSADHREDILRAAISVFGHAGYDAASTNEIVKQAKVSKGLLFHHFTNKETLYTACQQYVMEQYGQYMSEHLNFSGGDLFDRILHSLRVKIDFGNKNPDFLALLNQAPIINPEKFAPEAFQVHIKTFFEGIDVTKFREGMVLSKVMDYARLALEASWKRFSQRHRNDTAAILKDIDSYFAETEDIISLFRDGAYR